MSYVLRITLMHVFLRCQAVRTALSSVKNDSSYQGSETRIKEVAQATWQSHFFEYMTSLQQTDNELGFNPKCESYIANPASGVEGKGLVVLQHGYTACAGFWYLLKPRLLKDGWTVMAPTMPGHGRVPRVTQNDTMDEYYTVKDYTAELPTRGANYASYADELASIVKQYKADNPSNPIVLVGISHGGAVATYLSIKHAGLFNRVMLMNPFIQPPTSLGADYGLSFIRKILPKLLPAVGKIRGDEISWGEACDKKRWPSSTGGHGGMCQFTLSNFKAVLEFANLVESMARSEGARIGVFTGGMLNRVQGVAQYFLSAASKRLHRYNATGGEELHDFRVQLLTTVKDASIANSRVHFLARGLAKSNLSGSFGYCAMPEELGHVYISPIDNPTRDHWWLASDTVEGGATALDVLATFIGTGRFVPSKGTVDKSQDKFIAGDPLCYMKRK